MKTLIYVQNVKTDEYFYTTNHCQGNYPGDKKLDDDWIPCTVPIPFYIDSSHRNNITTIDEHRKYMNEHGSKEIENPDKKYRVGDSKLVKFVREMDDMFRISFRHFMVNPNIKVETVVTNNLIYVIFRGTNYLDYPSISMFWELNKNYIQDIQIYSNINNGTIFAPDKFKYEKHIYLIINPVNSLKDKDV